MSWILPLPLLLFAGVVALWPLAAVVRRPTSRPRLLAEAFGTTLAVIAIVQSDGSRAMPALKPRRSCRSATVGEVRPPPASLGGVVRIDNYSTVL
jgi:hypothetical protein